jgi:FAD/FMN-containing dehydrogenase
MASTLPVRAATFSSTQLDDLRGRVGGRVLVPGDEGYDAARQTWNTTTFDQRPALVVMPSSADDVAAAVRFAREHDLSIGVQGGGHGHPRPVDDALFVNFASMQSVQIAERGTARVEAGARWSGVIQAAHTYGLAPLNGFSGTVGVAGYTLGGGIGWLARQYGAAAGTLRAADVVTADGHLVQVSADDYADLFWGLRGGGGNFGIVTSLELDLYPLKEVFGGFIAYPLSLGREVLSAYVDWTSRVPGTMTSAARLVHFPPAPAIPEPLRGASAVVLMACSVGGITAGETLVKPLQSLGTPLLDSFRRMRYAEIGTIASDPQEAPPLLTFGNGGGLRELAPEGIDAMLRIAGDRGSGIFLVELRHAGGALTRQPEEAMPFGFRSPWFIGALAAAPTTEALESGKRSVAALLEALQPALTGELLINSLDSSLTSPSLVRAAYSADNYRRLVALKRKYDPANVFRFNHNIAPS